MKQIPPLCKLLILCAVLLGVASSVTLKACDESTITLNSQTSSGSNTTYCFTLTTELGGFDLYYYGFVLQFIGGTATPNAPVVVAGTYPASIGPTGALTSSLTGLIGSAVNSVAIDSDWNIYDNRTNVLSYEYGGINGAASNDFTINLCVTVQGCVQSILFDSSVNSGSSQCELTVSTGQNCNCTAPTPTLSGNNPTTCTGTNGSITLTGLTANTTYAISYNDDGVATGPTNFTSNASGVITISNLNAGAYTNITASLSGCSSTPANVTLTAPGVPTYTASKTDATACGASDGTIIISGLTPNTTYSLSYSDGGTPVGPTNFTSNASGVITISGQNAGAYTNIIVSLSGCPGAATSVTIGENCGPTIIGCSGTFTDTGGASGGYSNNEDYTVTYCSSNGLPLLFNFSGSNFDMDCPGDTLFAYNGTSATGTPIAILTYLDDNTQTTYSSQLQLGTLSTCVTFRFKSNASCTDNGWNAPYSCVAPPTCAGNPPAADLFGQATPICNLQSYCGTTATYYGEDTPFNLIGGGNCPATDDGGLFGGTIENNSWLSFQAGATTASFNFAVTNCGTGGLQIAVFGYSGNSFTLHSPCSTTDGSQTGNFTITATGLTVGNTYYIMIDGNAGAVCDYTVTANTGAVTVNAGPDQNVCSNSATMAATALTSGTGTWSVVSGTGTFSNVNSPTATVTGLSSGANTFTWTVSNGACSGNSDNVTITVSGGPTANAGTPQSVCAGGTINLSGSVGGGATGGTWSAPSGTFGNINSLNTTYTPSITSGSVTLTLTSVGGSCPTPAISTVAITVNAAPTASLSATQPTCGQSNGALTVSLSGVIINNTVWSVTGGGTSVSAGTTNATNLAAGTYSVTVTAAGGCTASATTTLNSSSAPTASLNTTQPTCGQNNGSLTVSLSSGTINNTVWTATGGGTTITSGTTNATNLSAGTYTVTVTATGGCTASATSTLNASTAPTASLSATQPTCGQSNGALTVSLSSGTINNTVWSVTGGGTSVSAGTTNATNLAAGTYSVTVTAAGGCTASATTTLNSSSAPTASLNTTQPTCGQNNGSLTVSLSSGTINNTVWTATGGGTAITSGTTNATNLSAGTYTVTVTAAGGCTASATSTLNASTAPTASLSATQPTCGQSNGALTVSLSSGTINNTVWSVTGGGTSVSAGTTNATNLAAGTYSVTVTAAGGCTASATTTLNSSSAPTASLNATQPTCGQNNGSLTVSLSSGTINNTVWTATGGGTTITSGTTNATNLSAGTYTVTVTATGGCTASATSTLNASTAPTASLSATQPTCGQSNGALTVSLSSGTINNTVWSVTGGGTSVSAGTTNATNLAAGTYSVTVTAAGGCTASATTTLNSSSAPTASLNATQPTCGQNNGSLTVSLSSGTINNTIWTATGGGTTITSGTTNATNLSAGTYTVTVTATGGCTASATSTLNTSTALVASTSITQPTCTVNTGSISVSPSGASNYVWSNAALSGGNPANVSEGSYTVTVTALGGCTATATATVNAPISFAASVLASQPSCGLNNGAIDVTPTGAAYSYAWNTAGVSGSNPTGLGSGTYTVTITNTSTGCTSSATTVLNAVAGLNVSFSTTQPSCGQNNGAISVTPNGPNYSYQWNNTSISGDSPNGLAAGNYSVTVTETVAGCSASGSVTLNNSSAPTASLNATQPTCGQNNGSLTVSLSSGTINNTVWTATGGGTTITSGTTNATNLSAGTYTVTVTAAGGCTASATSTLNASTALVASTSVTQPTCTVNTGSISVSPSGASNYVWSNAALSGGNPANVSEGSYTVTVTALGGCTATATATVNAPISFAASVLASQPSCGLNNGAIDVTPTGAAYSYAWNTAGVSGSNPTGLGSGTYTVTITNTSTGCTSSATTVLNAVAGLSVSFSTTQPSCGQNNGAISVTPNGPNYSYQWNNASISGDSPNGLAAGNYSVTVTETVAGCSASGSVTLNNSSAPTASLNATQPTCGQNNGSLTVSLSSGTINNTVWTATGGGTTITSGTTNATNLSAGTYTVTVTAADGCTASASEILNLSNNITANAGFDQTICEGDAVTLTASGGTTYEWSNGAGNTASVSVLPTQTTTFSVTVSDNACSATDNVTVTVNIPADAGSDNSTTVCDDINEGATTSDLTSLVSISGGVFTPIGGAPALSGTVFNGSGVVLGSYEYNYTMSGTVPCPDDAVIITVTVNDCALCPNPPTAGFSYAGPFCLGSGTATITLAAGASSGVFSAVPSGLVIDAATGTINLATSLAGVYTITNTISATGACPEVTATTSVTLNALPIANAGLDQTICEGDAVTLTASGGTTYEWSNGAGNTASVSVLPTQTTTFSVTVSDNACSATGNVTVTVNIPADAGSDNNTTVCDDINEGATTSDLTSLVSISGGVFTPIGGAPALSGTVFNGSGVVLGSYEYNYTMSGTVPCPDDAVIITVTVNDCALCPNPPTAGFSYAGPFCLGSGTATITLAAGASSGVFSAVPSGLVIDAATGTINLATSLAGVYTITNTISATGACPEVTATTSVTLNALPIANAGLDQTICEGDAVTLTASGGTTYEWSNGAGNTASVSVLPTQTTTFSVTVSDNACSATGNVTVTVNIPADAGSDNNTTVCDDINEGATTSDLTSLVSISGGVFTPIGGAPALSGTVFNGSGVVLGSYEYNYTMSGTVPCPDDAAIITVTVNDCALCPNPPTAGFSYAGPFCLGSGTATITLAAGASSGVFSAVPSGLVIDAATGTINLATSLAGVYTITNTISATGACPEVTATTSVTLNALPIANAGFDQTICEGDSVTLTASGGTTYEWSNGAGNTASVSVSPTQTTTFSVTVSDNACSATDNVTITVLPCGCLTPPPPVTSADTLTICMGEINTVEFTATSEVGTSINWYDAPTGGNLLGTGNSFVPTAAGTYYASAINTSNGGCESDRIAFVLEIDEVAVNISAPGGTTIEAGASVNIIATATTSLGSTLTYNWSPSNTLNCSICDSTTATPDITTDYTVMVSDDLGCSNTAQIQIVVNEVSENTIIVPNAFSPNGDGNNDIFRPFGVNITTSNLIVYNRWGNELFSTEVFGEGWDGKYKGNDVEIGVYVYYLSVTFTNGESKLFKGNLTLVR